MSTSNLLSSPRSPVGRILRPCPECGGERRIQRRAEAVCLCCGLITDSMDEVRQRRETAERVRRNALAARLQELLEDFRISELDVRMLELLLKRPLSHRELSHRLHTPPAVVQIHLRRLHEMGLVERSGQKWMMR